MFAMTCVFARSESALSTRAALLMYTFSIPYNFLLL